MDEIDRRIINALQGGFPIAERPFLVAAEDLRLTEGELLDRIRRLRAEGWLTRFGPMFDAGRLGGATTLAALAGQRRTSSRSPRWSMRTLRWRTTTLGRTC
ncbi:MAG: Lrp/AsnC family transcriptional regulator [Rhodospirillales bacterium]